MIILNMLLPEQNGLDVIRALRWVDPAVPIIAISGCGQTGTVDFLCVAETLGARRTVQKPFHLQEVLKAVHELTRGEREDTGPRQNQAYQQAEEGFLCNWSIVLQKKVNG